MVLECRRKDKNLLSAKVIKEYLRIISLSKILLILLKRNCHLFNLETLQFILSITVLIIGATEK